MTIDVKVTGACDFVRDLGLTLPVSLHLVDLAKRIRSFQKQDGSVVFFPKFAVKKCILYNTPTTLWAPSVYRHAHRMWPMAASNINLFFVPTTISLPFVTKGRFVITLRGCTFLILYRLTHIGARIPFVQNRSQVMSAVMRSLQKRSDTQLYVESPHGAETGYKYSCRSFCQGHMLASLDTTKQNKKQKY